jgi:hypothetical protein
MAYPKKNTVLVAVVVPTGTSLRFQHDYDARPVAFSLFDEDEQPLSAEVAVASALDNNALVVENKSGAALTCSVTCCWAKRDGFSIELVEADDARLSVV